MLKRKLKNTRIWSTLLLFAVLGGFLCGVTCVNRRMERDRCFQQLNDYITGVSRLLAWNMEEGRAYLTSVGQVLSGQDLEDRESAAGVLSSMGGAGLISRLELLLPGDLLLGEDGDAAGVKGRLSFEDEAALGGHIFWSSGGEEGGVVLRQCVPVERDGRTAAVLCGVVDLERITDLLSSGEYGGQLRLYVFERGSGQYLLNTWHGESSAVGAMDGREAARGYSLEEFRQAVTAGRAAEVVFRSAAAGEYFYTSCAPAAVEDWMVMVTLPDTAAFAFTGRVLRMLYGMAAVLLLALLVYLTWTFRDIRREHGEREQKLRNIHYILDVEKNLFQALTAPDGFHTALERAAEYLGAERAFFWAEDGLTHRQQRWWSDGRTERIDRGERQGQAGASSVLEALTERGAVVCQPSGLPAGSPEVEAFCRELGAEGLIMVPVKRRDGTLAGVLGAVNPGGAWESAEPLEQVAVSFSMTLEQRDAYQRLDRMSHVDAMTGLRNRNRFHEVLLELRGTPLRSFACVYIDANGLHELNNRLGHAAGDAMLVQVAEALTAAFPDDGTYRIGGDEFVALCLDRSEREVRDRVEQLQRQVRRAGYAVSAGVAWQEGEPDITELVKSAERDMRENKRRFYNSPDRERQLRILDERSAQMFSRQRDVEAFLSTIAPQFKGVYFVDLDEDSIRYLFIPSYFEHILAEKDGKFSKGLLLYADQLVKPEYREEFARLCDFDALTKRLDRGETPELTYEKLDGDQLQLRVTRTEDREKQGWETLWIFAEKPDRGQTR